MCLLIVLHRVHPEAPLIVAANRDERLARPTEPMAVLRSSGPRVLGGRDQAAGGTWLAVNEHGVVAALANAPSPSGPDPSKRSRGELPLALTRQRTAAEAVTAFLHWFKPEDYGPARVLVGDRTALFALDLASAGTVAATHLPKGVHILENLPFGARTARAERARRTLNGAEILRGPALRERLAEVLRSHEAPASCLHAGSFGTRETELVYVPESGRPRIWYSEGPPCRCPIIEEAEAWPVTGELTRGGG